LKYEIFVPYRIKGIPCLVAWFVMQWELLVTPRRSVRPFQDEAFQLPPR